MWCDVLKHEVTFIAVPNDCVDALVCLKWTSVPLFPGLDIAISACTSELQCLRRWEAGLCSPSRNVHQQLATVRVNRPKHCDPVSQGGGYGARLKVCWCLRWDQFAESSLCCLLSQCRKSQPRVATMLTGFLTPTHRTCCRESCE